MKWVVTADSTLCRIYEMPGNEKRLALVQEIAHPENRLKKGDYFTSDKPGHYKTDSSAHGSYTQRSDPKEVGIDRFIREVALFLNHARNENTCQQLIIIALPHVEGLLMNHLDKHVKELIVRKIPKDVMHLELAELQMFLENHRP